jgi:hypothetical protein
LNREPTVGEALAAFRQDNGLDPSFASSSTWTCRLGPVTLRLPNFRWRRDAILRHDLHHILTGIPCTLRGEFQMAAWEFAAGRFPHPAATLFCLPLVAAGVLWSPRSMWRAFLSGRRGRSLYGTEANDAFLRSPVSKLRANASFGEPDRTRLSDILAFCLLVVQAILLTISPLALVALAMFLF